jgi:putative DNA primase/helicase
MINDDAALIKRRNIEDEQTGEGYEVFEFRTVSGKTRQIRIPRAKSRNAHSVQKELLKLNADLPASQPASLAIVQRAIDTDSTAQLLYARAIEWRRRFRGFTFANAFVPALGASRSLVMPPLWAPNQGFTGLQRTGTLEGWRKRVGEPTAVDDILTLVIAACFAAPLLKVVNLGNFGFNLFGLTPDDRAVVASVAASVLG